MRRSSTSGQPAKDAGVIRVVDHQNAADTGPAISFDFYIFDIVVYNLNDPGITVESIFEWWYGNRLQDVFALVTVRDLEPALRVGNQGSLNGSPCRGVCPVANDGSGDRLASRAVYYSPTDEMLFFRASELNVNTRRLCAERNLDRSGSRLVCRGRVKCSAIALPPEPRPTRGYQVVARRQAVDAVDTAVVCLPWPGAI